MLSISLSMSCRGSKVGGGEGKREGLQLFSLSLPPSQRGTELWPGPACLDDQSARERNVNKISQAN